MGKKRVTLNLDEDLDDRWKKVSKKVKMSKSAMLESMLEKFIPELEKDGLDVVSSFYFIDKNRRITTAGSLFDEKRK